MSLCIDDCTELNNELLKAKKVKLLSLPFIKKFDIDVSDKVLNLLFGRQKE